MTAFSDKPVPKIRPKTQIHYEPEEEGESDDDDTEPDMPLILPSPHALEYSSSLSDFEQYYEAARSTQPPRQVHKQDQGTQTTDKKFKFLNHSQKYLQNQLAFSTDLRYSELFDDLLFDQRVQSKQHFVQGGCQVRTQQIIQTTEVPVLTQVECEYWISVTKHSQESGASYESYCLGLNTL